MHLADDAGEVVSPVIADVLFALILACAFCGMPPIPA